MDGTSKTPASKIEALETVSRSLNEAASLLARTDPADAATMKRVAEDLAGLARHPVLTSSVRAPLEVASERIAEIAAGTARDPAALFREAAQLMDTAGETLEEKRRAAACAPVAAPVPEGAAPAAEDTDSSASPEPEVATRAEAAAPPAPEPAAQAEPAAQPHAFIAADAALAAEFVTECREYIEQAEASLLALESDPDDAESVNTVFRAFHTIKGTAAFLGFDLISELAHNAENLLSRVRDKQIRCRGGYADLALRCIDMLKKLVACVSDACTGAAIEEPGDYRELLAVLSHPEESGVNEGPSAPAPQGIGRDGAPADEGPAAPASAAAPEEAPAGEPRKRPARAGDAGADSTVRVRTDRLDRLIDMVGELVIAQSMVAQDDTVLKSHRADLVKKVTHAGKIVRELQDLSMSMRMVPLKPTFQKMARLVRDLAHKRGKEIDFVSSGEDTEIDRNMVDVLNDPLVHMIRNAVDHGIEPPESRGRSGKRSAGTVRLAAFHAGGNVVVELKDDGAGLDRQKIVRKAVERGLIESDKGMSDGEVFNLIFEAGFSTADQVTEISGRGVGMDVVRRSVQSLRGRVEIGSESGRGTTFTVKLPLTLAVTDGMLIRVGAQRFILPTLSIHMSFRPAASAVSTVLRRGEMVRLRDDLIPIVRLHKLFNIPGALEEPTAALLVVVNDGDRKSALMVDELFGQQQVVAKPLGEGTEKVQGVAGAAILGDGRVGLILDAAGLIALSHGRDAGAGRRGALSSVAA